MSKVSILSHVSLSECKKHGLTGKETVNRPSAFSEGQKGHDSWVGVQDEGGDPLPFRVWIATKSIESM